MSADRKKTDQMRKPHARPEESTDPIELRTDGEQRFRAAVHAAAKSGPKHREPKEAKR